MNFLVIALISIAFATLLTAVMNLFDLVPAYIISSDKMLTLPAIAISAGVLIAAITYLRDKDAQSSDKQRKTDEVHLSIARDSFDEVYNLLKDQNNDRTLWVSASRLLLKTMQLKGQIQSEEIRKAFLLAEERLRSELYQVLSFSSEGNANRQPLPPQFFYGIDDWEMENSLDQAAIKADSKVKAHYVNIDENLPEPEYRPLAHKSIIAIYNFLEYPEDYEDPLSMVEDWKGNWADRSGITQGAMRYISHNKQKYVVNGVLHSRANNHNQTDV